MKKLAMIMEAIICAFACACVDWFLRKIREMEEEINLYIFRSAGGFDFTWLSGVNRVYGIT